MALPPLTVMVARVAVPFLNVTVPVGVGDAVCVMVAVNVTAWSYADGFAEEVNFGVESAFTT